MRLIFLILSLWCYTLQASVILTPAAGGSGNATQLQGVSILSTAPTNAQVLTYNSTDAAWEPATGGGGGGVTTMAAVGSTPSANGASISGVTLTLQPADATHPGVVLAGAQTFAGPLTVASFVGALTGNATNITASSNTSLTSLANLTAIGAQSQALNMNSHLINNVTDPSGAQDAATKNYVDTVASSLNPIQGVTAASTGDYPGTMVANVYTITALGALAMDDQSPAANSRVLLKNQTSTQNNGVYTVTTVGSAGVAPVLTRAADYSTAGEVNAGDLIPVINGTVNGNTSWLQSATVVTLNTDPLTFTQWTYNVQPVAKGGTGLSSGTSGGILAYTASGTLASSAALTANQLIVGGGAGVVPLTLAAGSQYQVLRMGASTPAYGSINLDQSAAVTGALAIGNGGTAATTAGAGFNALLQTVSATKTGTYSVLTTDSVILYDFSGGAFTTTLPTAVGVAGKTYRLINIGALSANQLTIATTSSQTVGPYASTNIHLGTPNESWEIISDGANWQILSHSIPNIWTNYTPTFAGMGTVASVTFYSRRVGDTLEVNGVYTTGTVDGTTASITIGFGGTSANVTTTSLVTTNSYVGNWNASSLGGSRGNILGIASGTTVAMSTAATLTPQAGNGILGNAAAVKVDFKVKIVGWEN